MASARRDDLAKRLAERLDKSPAKGRAMHAGSGATIPEGDSPMPAAPKRRPPESAAGKRAPSKQALGKRAPGKRAPSKQAPSKQAPSKQAPSKRAAPARRPPEPTTVQAARLRRGAAGTVLRGHLVPDAIHSDARRRKATLRSQRGSRVTWDDVMIEGLSLLIDRGGRVDITLDSVRRSGAATARRRLVQATLPAELDRGLVDHQLDLAEQADPAVTYEQLWASAILLWLDATK